MLKPRFLVFFKIFQPKTHATTQPRIFKKMVMMRLYDAVVVTDMFKEGICNIYSIGNIFWYTAG